MHKHKLRKLMKDLRTQIKPYDAAIFSAMIEETLLSLDCVRSASCVMAYCALGGEPDMTEFINVCIDLGKCVALPRVAEQGDMSAAVYHRNSVMECNRYGILEPMADEKCVQPKPDVIIVPGVVFDENGSRVGFGGGYYDRFLAQTDAVKIGVCFDAQITKSIKTDAHDVPMDVIVTQMRVIGVK